MGIPMGLQSALGYGAVATLFDHYIGEPLQGNQRKYYIERSCWDDGDLVIFPAISDKGERCQGQFFKTCELPRKLYLARRRRIQRLRKSQNFMDEINGEGVKILVSRVSKASAQVLQRGADLGKQVIPPFEEFPLLQSGDKATVTGPTQF
ncbi:hypothetical protein RRF57_011905 [Xylaria bambusicola]|uniref:Uncharacterized protein n=1 Tax=Xylaria bambusicola TaxID=326684 RepID=A0AAN7UVM6_9PEZI